ncbi:MAG: hypothetical protein A3C58_00405 [Candidatus Staskawiczbacteria bacterium RIFCSPHIGHO2_02_FULL_34_10]|uniref:phosphoglycerate mutase (2,3-diphosphoglycerate-dependent) n=1 Tax=Candidatus Staskawiczbacteria bacterium RIFCSPHIGHO2_02_FULL_34_10 TaxID=1802205 RepID=A0A1G2HVQ5_9BACT|nr:MAG: hypothetical protein A3C58_00405 [Candidatus Staskawiczbacteria bacterium RIFCSPHIGHO2_02_FULL_34_10]
MAKLYLQRHLKSQWNLDDRFAGWTDGPLIKDSDLFAKEFAQQFSKLIIDKAYCSVQFRSMDTLASIYNYIPNKYPMFSHIDGGNMESWGKYTNQSQNELPVFVTEILNERFYGILQGLNKKEVSEKYGEAQVKLWRRSYDIAPPKGESLKDVCKRVNPFFKKYIEKDLKNGKNVLVVASHNSLRAIVKHIENISDSEIANVELPFGSLAGYEFSEGKFIKK